VLLVEPLSLDTRRRRPAPAAGALQFGRLVPHFSGQIGAIHIHRARDGIVKRCVGAFFCCRVWQRRLFLSRASRAVAAAIASESSTGFRVHARLSASRLCALAESLEAITAKVANRVYVHNLPCVRVLRARAPARPRARGRAPRARLAARRLSYCCPARPIRRAAQVGADERGPGGAHVDGGRHGAVCVHHDAPGRAVQGVRVENARRARRARPPAALLTRRAPRRAAPRRAAAPSSSTRPPTRRRRRWRASTTRKSPAARS
jgi:hypothetical protein